MNKTIVMAAALVCAAGMAFANESTARTPISKPMKFFVDFGLTVGGDSVGTTYYVGGETQDIKAGGMLQLSGGVDYRWTPAFSTQASLGVHVDSAEGRNGGSRFTRFPVEVLGYYHFNDQFRLGAGVRFVSGAKRKGTGDFASQLNESADNTVGTVIEGEYFFSPNFGLKMRAVSEKYRFEREAVDKSGNHVGVLGALYF